ncbi:MAG: InlB B-repeat-containing protein [Bacteroidales bacterium]|nr:InlB B-repeat-containing protein [Bacteroidales bacterium]MCM1415152.1 InlB B-repeat-containing protein [bacterium]MCM1423388.1 InlB B-repeat-containing protein [bacterium]
MSAENLRRKISKSIAWLMTIAFLLPSAEKCGDSFFVVQAKEKTSASGDMLLGNPLMDGQGVVLAKMGNYAVVKKDGSLWTWGSDNRTGQLGNGTTEAADQPVQIMEDVKAVSFGDYSSGAAIKQDGSLWAWGDGDNVGDGTNTARYTPVPILDDVEMVSLENGCNFNGAVKTDHTLWVWGWNSISSKPEMVMENVTSISCGSRHALILKTDGSLWACGWNDDGCFGNGETDRTDWVSPDQPVWIMNDVVYACAGINTSAAIKKDGSLWVWGWNCSSYEKRALVIGDTREAIEEPVKIMDDVQAVSLGDREVHAALKKDGSLWTWGIRNCLGVEEGYDILDRDAAGPCMVMDHVQAVSNYGSCMAVKEDGSLWGWNSPSDYSPFPKQIMPPGSIATAASSSSPNAGLTIETQTKQGIKVLDSLGKPIVGAQITHLGQEVKTGETGYAVLPDYKVGEPIRISKENYQTLETAFRKTGSGCTTYVLSDDMSGVIMTLDDEDFDLLTKEVVLNRYDKKHFSIQCLLGNASYESCEIYSGGKLIAASSDGVFSDIQSDRFIKEEPVTLKLKKKKDGVDSCIEKELGIRVVDINPNIGTLSFGEDVEISIPADAPFMAGQSFKLHLGDSPIEGKVTTDGMVQIGINATELIKKDKDWFSTLKKLNKDNFTKELKKAGKSKGAKAPQVEADFDVIGYLEGNVFEMDRFGGKLFVELSAEASLEQGGMLGFIPVVVEVSIEGKVNADGSITFTKAEGISASLAAGGEINLGLYGGTGFQKFISAGIYGKAGLGLQYQIFPEDARGLNEFYFQGEAGAKGKLFSEDLLTWKIIEGKYVVLPKSQSGWAKSFAIDNDKVYAQLDRSYLNSDGAMTAWTPDHQVNADGSLGEMTLQSGACLDVIPKVVRMGDTVMLFYLTDAGAGRDAADRSMLVYSLWDRSAESWSEPKAVADDGTADFAPDLYSDGEKIYAVWQNGTQSLKGDLTLNEIAKRLTLHTAVYDKEQDRFVSLGDIQSGNGLFQQNPQIVSDGGSVSVYWYENETDNVLGLSGTNRIYRAVLQEAAETGAFRKFVALTEEPEKTVPENTVSENTVSENTVSENTISEDIISEDIISGDTENLMTFDRENRESSLWSIRFVQEEADCIVSADAGKIGGAAGYAYAAGKLDGQLNLSSGRVALLTQDRDAVFLGDGKVSSTAFVSLYGGETLSWYQEGDIYYLNGEGKETALFGESRLPSSNYTLLSDSAGCPEVIFPINRDGKADLYRIGYEDDRFLAALQVTDQEDYIQYADGFVENGNTILVYNRMKVNEQLEEVENSLSTGTLAHSYYDIAIQSVGSMLRQDVESGEDKLEISALLYNNGTVKAEDLSLSLLGADGTELETKAIDTVLESGESGYGTALFSPDIITAEAEYTVKVSGGGTEVNQENNSSRITLGGASLQLDAEVISIADTRTVSVGIRNTGKTPCGGTVSLRDSATGEEYAGGSFEPIAAGETAVVEEAIDAALLAGKDAVALEIVVTPDTEGVAAVSDFVMVYAPVYEVHFVTDAETATVYAKYGENVPFPKNPTKNGAYFIGWYDDQTPASGTLYTEETPIKKSVTLYACFADQERAQIPLSECSVSAIPAQYHTGSAIKPKLTVKWGSEVLKNNTDYMVTYQDNKEQGKATATVTGKGKYSGSISRDFMIYYPISKISVKAIPAVNFSGEEHTPELTITYKGKNLVKNTDYTVAYTNNRNAGTAGVTITGKGKYNGQKTVTFQIKGTAISGMKFEKIPDVTYNGAATRPIITVKTKDGKQLMPGSDYRLVYENTVKKGTASVTVIGNGNYTGTKKLSYKIVAKPLTEAMISQVAEQTYTGSAIKPAVTVTDREAGNAVLVRDQDYTVSYSKNKAVGTAKITVKGKGNYSGKVELPFTISPVELAQAQETGELEIRVNDMAYTGRALKPAVQLYEITDGREKKIPAGGYTAAYANNSEMGTGTVTVTGKEKSGYTGTVTAQFRIVEKAELITASTIKIDGVPAQTFTGAELKPAVHIVDRSDKTKEITLEQGTHYEVSYKNHVNAGKATVTIKGIGSYAGSKNITFKINKRPIADKNVPGQGFTIDPVADLKYTGYALKPDVVLKDKGTTLEQGKDYKLSYKNNTKIGTAAVTVKGMGNYSGSINTTTFRIVAWDYNTLRAEVEGQTYTGKALKPKITFYAGEEAIDLKTGTAVKITYKDNKNVGTATVTVSGKGELRGIEPLTLTFAVAPADLADAVVNRIANQTLKGVPVKPVPKVRIGKNSLKAGRDFTVSYLRNGVKGEATVIISGVGNYTGECRKTFIVQ